ncbi:hypothetical protein FK739_12425 [Escherichia coli]|nr:hypothetical protein [Escherichia coli]
MLRPRHEGFISYCSNHQQTPTYLQLNIHNNLTLRHYFRYGYAYALLLLRRGNIMRIIIIKR